LTEPERSSKGMTRSRVERTNGGGLDTFFTSFATWISKWTGSHRAIVVAAVLVILCLLVTDVETTNLVIAIVTLLMVFVLQNTQNRDSAALHLKLDEMVRAEPHARDEIRGVESKSHDEIGGTCARGHGHPCVPIGRGSSARTSVLRFPQNSPIRSARSKSGSIKTWTSSERAAGGRPSRRSRSAASISSKSCDGAALIRHRARCAPPPLQTVGLSAWTGASERGEP